MDQSWAGPVLSGETELAWSGGRWPQHEGPRKCLASGTAVPGPGALFFSTASQESFLPPVGGLTSGEAWHRVSASRPAQRAGTVLRSQGHLALLGCPHKVLTGQEPSLTCPFPCHGTILLPPPRPRRHCLLHSPALRSLLR